MDALAVLPPLGRGGFCAESEQLTLQLANLKRLRACPDNSPMRLLMRTLRPCWTVCSVPALGRRA
eukprot:3893159-Prorocentrum_lima.AAC.1